MFGESVIFFNQEHAAAFKYRRKQGMQLGSKMRYLAAQFIGYLRDGLWLSNAEKANAMAQVLAQKALTLNGVELFQPVQTNGVFVRLPREAIAPFQKESFFYVWDETACEVRWMTAYDTSPDDIDNFIAIGEKILGRKKT